MARILTGVQSTGVPHLGNLLGAVLPAIKMAEDQSNEAFLFIADLHSITQVKDGAHINCPGSKAYASLAAELLQQENVNL